jgi:hypothetical protein
VTGKNSPKFALEAGLLQSVLRNTFRRFLMFLCLTPLPRSPPLNFAKPTPCTTDILLSVEGFCETCLIDITNYSFKLIMSECNRRLRVGCLPGTRTSAKNAPINTNYPLQLFLLANREKISLNRPPSPPSTF